MLEPPMRERIAQAIWDTWRVSPHGNEDSAALEWDQIRGVDQTQYPTLASCVETAFAEADAVLEVLRTALSEAYAEGRAAGVEAAAKAVEDAGGDNEDYHADAIRSLLPSPATDKETT